MSSIQILDPITVTQIAAGEVVERPVSIVKELIENSLDSGASSIQILLEEGGKRRIQITDNGAGISYTDLPLAAHRHSTSKIQKLDDLYFTDTFGFRGEALASISHVAKLTITSKQENSPCYQLSSYLGEMSQISQVSGANGTVMEVTDLFFELPVRARFLKSSATELSYITEVVTHFALSHPLVDFTLIHEGEILLNSKGISDLKTLLVHFYGKDLKTHLVPVEFSISGICFSGMVTTPQFTVGSKSKQVFTVNRRLVKNASLYKALQDAFKDLIPQRRFPVSVLNLTLHSESVDVNVHPQKLDVKFLNPGFLYTAFSKAISAALMSTTTLPLIPTPHSENTSFSTSYASVTTPSFASSFTPPFSPLRTSVATLPNIPALTEDLPISFSLPVTSFEQQPLEHKPTPVLDTFNLHYFQVFDTYLVISGPDGLYLMDQHAVHERVLYEKFKSTPTLERQSLLISEIITLESELMPVFDSHQRYLENLGFLVESFGPNQIAVREVPSFFANSSLSILLPDLLSHLSEFPNSNTPLELEQKEILQMKACKAAIKAGQKLHPLEVKRLVQDLIHSPSNYTCPHGRPLYIKLDKGKLERLFLRA